MGLESKLTKSSYHTMYKQMDKERRAQLYTLYTTVAALIGILLGGVFLIGVSFW